jgi:hypothetical protein
VCGWHRIQGAEAPKIAGTRPDTTNLSEPFTDSGTLLKFDVKLIK